ncbi:alpha/beta hydrolase [Dyella sp. C9]|uniref:alpha/beta hydrolase n=1 Tax=Dyella sp. C9 TaxID=2202154 RepID=UPI000DEF4FA6|nr:alpha/beta hydrolase fold domain-containing protein [Dyella sp. C9]
MIRSTLLASLLLASLVPIARAQEALPRVDADGGIHTAAGVVPFASGASPEAQAFFPRMLAAGSKAPPITAPIEQSRAFYDRLNNNRAGRMARRYPVHTHHDTLAGVGVDVVEPAQGIASRNRDRVLINLHGGAFLWGAHSGGLVESIPIASLGRIKVVSVDYRQGPEHVFPAASEDGEAVYRELLRHYAPGHIGIYGCSAGGVLTGEVVARLVQHKLPVPGAIGTFCGSLVDMEGDSAYTAALLNGSPLPTQPLRLQDLPYFKGVSPTDPQVFPGLSPALLAHFPPTLLITGTRDMAMSAVVRSQTLLSQAGVDTELHVWEGMWHSFFSDPELPESQSAYAVIVKFFDRHLGQP